MKKLMKFFWIGVFVITIILLNINGIIAAERPLRTNWTWPARIDPAIGVDTTSTVALINLYDALVFPDVNGDPQPHVAESWKVSDDGLSWTFYIRKGIKFHDGSELTASDVKFSFDRLRTIGRGYAFFFLGQEMSAEVIDTFTVNIYLERSSGPFLQTLMYFFILNEDLVRANIEKTGEYGELGDYGKEYLVSHDASSGPYMMKDFSMATSLTMVVNPNYFLPIDPNSPDEFEMIGTTEAITVRTLLAKRELDIGDVYQAPENLETLKNIEGIEIAQFPVPAVWNLMMNTKKPPTDDIHFRKAMAWATDYDTIVNYIWKGSIQARGPIPHILSSHDPTVFQYHRNLDKAMEELKQSKYYGQLEKYPVELHWCTESAEEEKPAMVFMSNMADIGIEVKVVSVPWMLLLKEELSLETSPTIICAGSNSPYAEAGGMLELRYSSKGVGNPNQNEWLQDPKFDAMLEDALATVDKDERFAKYNKLQHYIVDLCPTIWLVDRILCSPFQSSYVDWYVDEPFSPIKGHYMVVRNIKIYPEKKAALLK